MPAHFENGEKCDGSKVSASVHTMPEQFENGVKLRGYLSTVCGTGRCHFLGVLFSKHYGIMGIIFTIY